MGEPMVLTSELIKRFFTLYKSSYKLSGHPQNLSIGKYCSSPKKQDAPPFNPPSNDANLNSTRLSIPKNFDEIGKIHGLFEKCDCKNKKPQ
jgi:hypothetical protein